MGKVLAEVSGGDLRRAINYLQNSSTLFGDELSPQGIIEVAGVCRFFSEFSIIFYHFLSIFYHFKIIEKKYKIN